MDLDVVFFGILACVYSLILSLPRIRRELSAMETVACIFVVLVSVVVLGFNMTKDAHPRIIDELLLIELGLVVFVACLWVMRLVARRRQSG